MKRIRRFMSGFLTIIMVMTSMLVPGNQITVYGAPGEAGLEEDAANFVLGAQSKLTSNPVSGKVLEITSGWNSNRLNGVAKFQNSKDLFGRTEFTYSAYVYNLADNANGSAFTVGNADSYFSINLAPLAIKYKDAGKEEVTKNSDVKETIGSEWVRLTVSYKESETSGEITVYIDEEEVISAQEIGFKLSGLDTVEGYIGGTFFNTSYMGHGKYDDITVLGEAFDYDEALSNGTERVTAILGVAEERLKHFSEEADHIDFQNKADAEEYIDQWLAEKFSDTLSEGLVIHPYITALEPLGERYKESFEGEGSLTFSLKVSAGIAYAFTSEITCEMKFTGGEIPVYNSFSGVARGTGDKEQSLWLDTDGVHIQAHGGQVQKVAIDGTDSWVWYGEDKTRNGNPIDGVNCYVSNDLYNWENKGTVLWTHDIFPARLGNDGEFADRGICLDEAAYAKLKQWAEMSAPTDEISQEDIDMAKNFVSAYVDESSDTGYDEESMKLAFWNMYTGYNIVERPKMLYNEETGKYIIVYHQDGPDATRIKEAIENGSYKNTASRYSRASMGFAVSDNPFGPFKLVNVQWMNGYPEQFSSKPGMARDMNVFMDDTDIDQNGVPDAYAVYSSEENKKIYISLLNDEYTGPATQGNIDKMTLEDGTEIKTFATRVLPDNSRESPAIFKSNGYYYMLTSGTTGWNPNPGIYYRAQSIYGPWTKMGDFCEGGSNNTFRSQNTAVIPYDPEAGLFIYMGDRWRTENNSSALWYSSHVWLPIQITPDNKIEVKNVSNWNLDMLSQYAPLTINTELPGQVVYGKTDALPASVNVTVGNDTFDAAVTWEEPKALGTQTIKGTLTETGRSISFETVVVIENAVYFVDCGAESPEGRDYFNLIGESSGDLLQNSKIPDQAYETGSWGYEGDNTNARSGELDVYELLRYISGGSTGRDLIYSFDGLEKGEYSVYLGFFNPVSWASANRVADISLKVNDKTAGTAQHKIADGVKDMVVFDNITADADSKLQISLSPKNTGKNTDVQISYIAVVKAGDEENSDLTQISIEELPDKTEYNLGEELDLTGLKVMAEYSDESTKQVNIDKLVVTGYDSDIEGEQKITLTYKEGETAAAAEFYVTVNRREITEKELIIRSKPAKLSYYSDEELDTTGMVIELCYSDGSKKVLDPEDYIIDDYDFNTKGEVEIKVLYRRGEKELTASFMVTVSDSEELNDEKIVVVKGPDRKVYSTGEDFDAEGMEVRLLRKATSSNASRKEVVNLSPSDYETEYDFDSEGVKTVKIIYCGSGNDGAEKVLQTELKVTVIDGSQDYYPVKLKVTNKPYRSIYNPDEELDLTGIKVMLTRNIASPANASRAYTEEITDYEVEEFDSSITGTRKVSVFVEALNEDGEEYILSDSFEVRVVKRGQQAMEDKIGAIVKQQKDQFKDIDPDVILPEEQQDFLYELYGNVKDILIDNETAEITSKIAENLNYLETAVLEAFPQLTVTIDGEKTFVDDMNIYGTIWAAEVALSDGSHQNIVVTAKKSQLPDHDFEFQPGSKITGIDFETRVNGQKQDFTGPVWISMTIPKGQDQNSDVYCFADGNDGLKLTPVYQNNKMGIWVKLPAVLGFVKEEEKPEKTLLGIEIVKKPQNTTYYYGERLVTDGMVIQGIYSDGTTALLNGYEVEEVTFTSYGKHRVKVVYEGHVAYLEVDVIHRKSSSEDNDSSESESRIAEINDAVKLNASLVSKTGTVDGEWKKDNAGWWYALTSGGYAKNQWAQIGNMWYLFDQKGYMCTGWRQIDGTWYFLQESGVMAYGAWIEDDGKWYYLTPNGAMAVNQSTPDGYQVGTDGAWIR